MRAALLIAMTLAGAVPASAACTPSWSNCNDPAPSYQRPQLRYGEAEPIYRPRAVEPREYSPYVRSLGETPNMRGERRLLDSPLETPDYRGQRKLKSSIYD